MRKKIYDAAQNRPIESVDDSELMEMFHGYSKLIQSAAEDNVASGANDDDDRELSEENAQEALFEGLRKWNIELNEEEEKKIKDTYFTQQWNLFRNPSNNQLRLGDSVNLFRAIVKDISGTLNPYYN